MESEDAAERATTVTRKMFHFPRDNAKHEHSSQASTLSGSWDITAITTIVEPPGTGIDVPAFLQPLFGMDFLPYATPPIPEGEESDIPDSIPRSVEISSEQQQQQQHDDFPESPEMDDDEISVHAIHRLSSPLPKPEETEELQLLLLHHQHSARKQTKRGFRAAARAVLHRVTVKKRAPKGGLRQPKETAEPSITPVHQAAHKPQQAAGELWIFPTATATTEITLSPLTGISATMDDGKLHGLRQQAQELEHSIQETSGEIENLQSKLAASIARYQAHLADFQITQKQLEQMVQQMPSSTGSHQPESEANGSKEHRAFKRSESGSFIRVHDLDLGKSSLSSSSSSCPSMSSLSQSSRVEGCKQPGMPAPEFLQMDHYLIEIVQQLIFMGFELAIDEGKRYNPTRDTARLLSQAPNINKNSWPIDPWTHAFDNHVLVWTGHVSHAGFGHTWPVVKSRAVIHASTKRVLEFLWDSSLVPLYNPMWQGRDDVYVLQEDVEIKACQSPYGFTGCAKIVRSLNKHRLLSKGIETKSLMYARPLEQHTGSYILVSRSVWENDTATLDEHAAKSVIRTEVLLGCTIMRALNDDTCEMTQVTHAHLPGVPELLTRRTAPNQCVSLMQALQSLVPPPLIQKCR
jgi:hypothetical protein